MNSIVCYAKDTGTKSNILNISHIILGGRYFMNYLKINEKIFKTFS